MVDKLVIDNLDFKAYPALQDAADQPDNGAKGFTPKVLKQSIKKQKTAVEPLPPQLQSILNAYAEF